MYLYFLLCVWDLMHTGSIDIDRGNRLHADLRTTQQNLVIDNYLHLLYLVTPYDMIDQVKIDWMTYLHEASI